MALTSRPNPYSFFPQSSPASQGPDLMDPTFQTAIGNISRGVAGNVQPVVPGNPVNGNDMLQLLQLILGQQQQTQQGRLGQAINEQSGIRRDIGGAVMDPMANRDPFSNGFFQGADQRYAQMESMTPPVGVPRRNDYTNPYYFGSMGPGQVVQSNAGFVAPGSAFNPTTIARPGGGFEGMIDPNAPQATKYTDANMFSAIPGSPGSLPPGAVAGDGKTAHKRSKPGNFRAPQNPRSIFAAP